MARPATLHQALRQTHRLLDRRLPGARRTTVRAQLGRANAIATAIYQRWQLGPYQWQVKHLRWYLTQATATRQPGTRYRHWLTVRVLLAALGRETAWAPRLQGPWRRPNGRAGPLGIGRPVKRPT